MSMRTIRGFLAIIVASVVACVWASGAETGLSAEAKADFEWFSGLGFPDVKNLKFVEYYAGGAFQSPDSAGEETVVYGFLISRNGNTNAVLDSSLTQLAFTNFPARAPRNEVSIYGTVTNRYTNYYHPSVLRNVDLRKPVREFLDEQSKLPTNVENYTAINRFRNRFPGFGNDVRATFFVLAWDCWQQGLVEEAQQIYAIADRIPGLPRNEDGARPFRERLEKDFGKLATWRATVKFSDTNVSRADLLSEFQMVERRYPNSDYHKSAHDTVERLTKMIEEDRQHAAAAVKPLEQLSMDERVKELIFRLRDQNGRQESQPGHCDIFYVIDRGVWNTNTPAHELVKIGFPAVPHLIASLDNSNYSRSVGFWREGTFSHTVLTVGDCAAQILNQIAGKAFYQPKSTSSYLSKDGDVVQVRRDAEAWWNEVNGKGQK